MKIPETNYDIPVVTADVIVAQNASLSEAIDMGSNKIFGIITPALEALTAKIGFRVSADGETWTTEHLVYQGIEYTLPIADPTKTYPLAVDIPAFFGFRYLKIECLNAAGAALAQATAARTFKVLYGPG
jgi:hypothetical protein